jgi:hypothetical protein
MKWYSAHLGSDPNSLKLYDQIVSEFKRIYSSAVEPKEMALFEATDSFGTIFAVYLSPASVAHCQSLFEMCQPWLESDGLPAEVNVTWLAGDNQFVGWRSPSARRANASGEI